LPCPLYIKREKGHSPAVSFPGTCHEATDCAHGDSLPDAIVGTGGVLRYPFHSEEIQREVRMPECTSRERLTPGQASAATPDWSEESFSFILLYRKEEGSHIVASPIAGFEIPERHSGNGRAAPAPTDAMMVLPYHC